ncbi:MAG: HEAT repeat domain-containing protein, partial [Gemmatimonadota bacterium]|nr:HEAT repeat domain-containing protein [Gemmatimonadota bacterium]
GLSGSGEAHDTQVEALMLQGTAGRWALARALRNDTGGTLRAVAGTLLDDPAPEVRAEAIQSLGLLGDARFADRLIEALGDRALRPAARRSLSRMGKEGLDRMRRALLDPIADHSVRRHVPEAIAAQATTQAASVLVTHLRHERDGLVRFKILQALGRMRTRQPALPLDHNELRTARGDAVRQAASFMRIRHGIEGGSAEAGRPQAELLLLGLLRDKQNHALERTLRLLSLETRNDDFRRIYLGLKSSRADVRAGARELLENLLGPGGRTALLGLVDDAFMPSERPSPGSREGFQRALRDLLSGRIESLRALAATVAAERAMVELRGAIAEALAARSDYHVALTRAHESLGRLGDSS